jgi:hypothetical protein
MPDHAETLKSMLQSIINDRHEEASVTMHDYFVSKTKEVAGLGEPQSAAPDFDETDPDEINAE